MPQIDQLCQEIAKLEPFEREELALALSEQTLSDQPLLLLRLLSQRRHSVEFPGIVSSPDICGGVARLIRTRIPVWTIVRMRQLGASEIDILRSFPTLRAVDLVQAWAYADRNAEEIEKAIRENEEE